MTNDNIILKINRHLFSNGTSKKIGYCGTLSQGVRILVSIGLQWSYDLQPVTLTTKGKGLSRNVQSEIKFVRQGIPFGRFVHTQLDFPYFWRSLPF
jgi:hypothetical protein